MRLLIYSPEMERKQSVVYLDNNATTMLCRQAADAMDRWNEIPANASSSSRYGVAARKMMEDARKYILGLCGAKNYRVIFTSGASESNALIIRSTVEAYRKMRHVKPHILTGATEHKSVLECCRLLESLGTAEVTYIAPGISGCIPVSLVTAGIRSNTCLVSIMSANNEIGCINDLKSIGAAAHAKMVPFHSDCVQTFGKFKVGLPANNIDAISVSFHKLYGPKGCGLLVVNNDLIEGYKLSSQIAGTQEFGLRGGTENIAAIAGGIAALKCAMDARPSKNAKLRMLRQHMITGITKQFPRGRYENYVSRTAEQKEDVEVVILGERGPMRAPKSSTAAKPAARAIPDQILPNTVLIALAKNKGKLFCNTKLKTALEKTGIIVAIGSACNTSSPDASHVLAAIHAPDVIRRGVIRISLCDHTTKKEVDSFIREFTRAAEAQLGDVDAPT